MCVEIVTSTHQRFNGQDYYLCGKYFSSQKPTRRGSSRLHRVVWEYHNGPIPKGKCVHHLDGNRANNSIENLILMGLGEHNTWHMLNDAERREKTRRRAYQKLDAFQDASRAWRKTPEGKAWHKQHAKECAEAWKTAIKIPLVCAFCGGRFVGYQRKPKECCCQSCWKNQRKFKKTGIRPTPRKLSPSLQAERERLTA